MEKIPFLKLNGCGNDFIIIDNRNDILKNLCISEFAKKVCKRKISVGADGLMLLEKSHTADFKMRYFNADGSEGEMCGNGARCISKFANMIGAAKTHMEFETISGIYKSQITGDKVKVDFPPVHLTNIKLNKTHNFQYKTTEYHYCLIGVPHVVILADDINKISYEELISIGRTIRSTITLFPQGTNVNFVELINECNIKIRTYERGVEDETLACGTGSTAAAIVLGLLGKAKPPINVYTRGGMLKIHYKIERDLINEINMAGEVRTVFEGEILPDAWR
ncbi:MAG TPA: diaminopimelate epimerase [Thermoanaerobacterales bacterium]|nr:diaminopimelate epimerase [Thermoanaerobacterales bacterium]